MQIPIKKERDKITHSYDDESEEEEEEKDIEENSGYIIRGW